MDLTELGLLVGEVRNEQKNTNAILLQHLEAEIQRDIRLQNVEEFVGNSKKWANIVGTVMTATISFLTLKWLK